MPNANPPATELKKVQRVGDGDGDNDGAEDDDMEVGMAMRVALVVCVD